MPALRTARRKPQAKTDPITRRLQLRQRKEEAPPGFFTRRALCEKVGLTDTQFRTLARAKIVVSDGANSHGYALYSLANVDRLVTMKRDGSLFRQLSASSAASKTPHASPPAFVASPTLHYSAEDGVRVFELLRDGKTLEEIILTTRIHPLLVKAIRVDYDDITGSIHLPKYTVDQLNVLGRDGRLPGAFPVRDDADVLAVLELCAVDRTCSTCERNAALSSCEDCLNNARRASLPRTA